MIVLDYHRALREFVNERKIDLQVVADMFNMNYKTLYNNLFYYGTCSVKRWIELADAVGFDWHPWEKELENMKKSTDDHKHAARERMSAKKYKMLKLEAEGKKRAEKEKVEDLPQNVAASEEKAEKQTLTENSGKTMKQKRHQEDRNVAESRDNEKQVKDIGEELATAPRVKLCDYTDDVPCSDCSSFYKEADATDVPEQVDPAKEFVEFVGGMFDALKEQFIRKNEQYGDKDPLGNFRKGAFLRYGNDSYENMFQAALDYEGKHLAHVYGHGTDGKAIDESLKDIAIYSLIELYMLKKAQEG